MTPKEKRWEVLSALTGADLAAADTETTHTVTAADLQDAET